MILFSATSLIICLERCININSRIAGLTNHIDIPALLTIHLALLAHHLIILGLFYFIKVVKEKHGVLVAVVCPGKDISSYTRGAI